MTDAPTIAQEPIGSSGSGSGSPAISVTDDQVFQALGDFLTRVTGAEVSQGQLNRGPEPSSDDHIIMTAGRRIQLSTTVHEVDGEAQTDTVSRSTQADMQIDIYGPRSTDNAQIFTTLFRDAYGCGFFADYGMQPLYCDDGRQMPLVNGEKQYEARWMIQASIQISPAVVVSVQSADEVAATIVEADGLAA